MLPVVVVHGGAGFVPRQRSELSVSGVCSAAGSAYGILKGGGSSMDAVVEAVTLLENNPAFNAGIGSVLNVKGDIEMDALVMDGKTLASGAVSAVRNIANPTQLARLVMEKTSHACLTAEGASQFARAMGIPEVPLESLITDYSRMRWQKNLAADANPVECQMGKMGTVGAVAVDTEGNIACATSTGGMLNKMVGRVGDTPCIVAEMTDGFHAEGKKKSQSRSFRRLQKLKRHHDMCEERYEKAHTKRLDDQRKETLSLSKKNEQQWSSDSDGTFILDLTPADVEKDPNVPELRRTDSVILTRQMDGYATEQSLSSSLSSGEEYVPETAEESKSDCSAEIIKRLKGRKRKLEERTSAKFQEVDVQPLKKRFKTPYNSPTASDTRESSSPDADQTRESSSPDSSDVMVMTLKKKENGGRVYNKKFYCVFCSKPFSKMARHLESKHKDIPEVARAVACPVGSKERKIQLTLLRNKGNRAHNNQVLKEGKGMMIPRQQSCAPVKSSDYLHCINCEGYLKRKSLWRHMQRCQLSSKVKGLKPGMSRVQALCRYAEPVPDSVNAQFWKLVQSMHDDDITKIVHKEKCILKLGEHLFNKHGHDVTKHNYIRQKMREAARLVMQGQKHGKLNRMSDFFVPANFPYVIDTVKKVAGFDENTHTYKTPSLALKSGHNLRKVADVLECEAMISGDENTINNMRVFKQICDTKWNECISSTALRTLNEAKWNAPQLLPFTEDVKKMHQYLDKQRLEYQTKLKEQPKKKYWAELAKITLCDVILFNRRREGEVSKMSLNAFTLRNTSSTHPDVELSLTELEKRLCKHFQRIEIRGKRGRKVPILLTPDMQASMELIVKTRRSCDVLDENPFMFGRPQTLTHFRGSDVIRQVAQSCGAQHPEVLSSTKLRKHMATMSKILNLKENEMDDLADFLGHDIRVHRQYYRLPEGTLQLAKISKVLMALERGQLPEFKGKNLDEIIIDPQENIALDCDATDTEDEDASSVSDAASQYTQSSGKSGLKKKSTNGCTTERNKHLFPAEGRSDEEMTPVCEVSGEVHTRGSGGYADNNIGAVSTTGHGETIMKVTLARLILFHMEQGQSVEAASDSGLAFMKSRVDGLGGVISVDPQGHWAARFSSLQMAWAAAQRDTLHYGLYTGEHFTQNIDDPEPHYPNYKA